MKDAQWNDLMLQMLAVGILCILIYCLIMFWIQTMEVEVPGREFTHPDSAGNRVAVSSIFSSPEVDLTVAVGVVAGSGVQHLEGMLSEATAWLSSHGSRFKWEIVLAGNDCPEMKRVGADFLRRFGVERIRLLVLPRWSPDAAGVGGLCRRAVLVSRGSLIVTVQSSGSVRFSDVTRLDSERLSSPRNQSLAMVVGTRWKNHAHWQSRLTSKILGFEGLRDPASQFRLFTRPAAALLFTSMRSRRSAGTAELLLLARHAGVAVMQTDVRWIHIGAGGEGGPSFLCVLNALRQRIIFGMGLRIVSFSSKYVT
mmetsp:Transcript_8577/g.25785  ORF Transcript_8577/g.25785 Transcript_8577/m.25785 type:complete len:311 (-) Transcript_8577:1460-2392(-)